ncbi:MAG: hypothetical protein RL065_1944 [Bacteroidota bacterium]|jgi:hypothetical protein
MKIILTPPYIFTIQPYKNRLKLIVLKKAEEFVCRKETKKKIIEFLDANDCTLFKGRLQLIKKNSEVLIQVKSEILGSIPVSNFYQILETI